MTETLVGQFPKHIGSTGGLLNSAETEEKYAISWNSSKEQAFELPTGGAAVMHEGDNLMYFARKEQCLALGTQLRGFKPMIENFKIPPQQSCALSSLDVATTIQRQSDF